MKSIWIGNMINIGIIGNGFVGSAIAHGFSLWSISSTVGQQLRIYDANPQLSSDSFDDVATKSDIVFVCVPTPMNLQDSGAIDLTILNSVMNDLSILYLTQSFSLNVQQKWTLIIHLELSWGENSKLLSR